MAVDQRALSAVLEQFAATVTGDFTVAELLRQLGEAAARVLGVDGAGVMVAADGQLLRFMFATTSAVAHVEWVQDQHRTGPCHASHATGDVTAVPDLQTVSDWPQYRARAGQVGLRSVTAIPLRARGRRWGVLDVYSASPRRLSGDELAAARTLANVATSYLVVTADRDAARHAQEQLAHQAMHDPLTGLPLRWVFLEQLAHALTHLTRHAGQVGVMFLDVDGLKHVNDTLGHAAGDRLLLTCVQRVRDALRPTDVIARAGGDEFVVLLEGVTGVDAAAAIADRVLTALAAPLHLDGQVLQPSASVGLVLTDHPGRTPDSLIAHADAAMYRAKRGGRGRYELFDAAAHAAEHAASTASAECSAALRSALRADQLELHYQPIVDLTGPAAGRTGTGVYAVEALARWRHPQRGLLTAGQFMDTADRAGLLPELDAWALTTACRQLAAWDRSLGPRAPQRVFVNISAAELTQPDLPGRVAAVLHGNGLSPARLTLEITETGLFTDPPAALAAVAALQQLGCHLAIDDFGTGHSSLSRLVQLPGTTLKIDQSFTRDLHTSPAAAAVVSAVLQLGRALDRTVVVEGVESAAVLQTLRRLGCTHAQGFHLAPPRPPHDLVPAGCRTDRDVTRETPACSR